MLLLCGVFGVELSALGVLLLRQPALSCAFLWELQIKHSSAKPAASQRLSFLLAQPPALTHLFPTDTPSRTHGLVQMTALKTGEHTMHVHIHFQNYCLHHFLQLFRQSWQWLSSLGQLLGGMNSTRCAHFKEVWVPLAFPSP